MAKDSAAFPNFKQAIIDGGFTTCFYTDPCMDRETLLDGTLVEAICLVEPYLDMIPCYHENVATGGADAFARMTGKPALAVVDSGPGCASGLANMHNAKRAGVPMVVIVSDRPERPELEMMGGGADELAGTVSKFVRRVQSADTMASDFRDALAAIAEAPVPMQSNIATLIIPDTLTWSEATGAPAHPSLPPIPPRIEPTDADIAKVASVLASDGEGACILLSNQALHEPALSVFGKIAEATGAKLCGVNSFSRCDRGVGRPYVERVPYFPNDALKFFTKFKTMVLCDAAAPVAQFGYEDGISSTVPETTTVHEFNFGHMLDAANRLLAQLLSRPGAPSKPPPAPRVAHGPAPNTDGKLTPSKMCHLIAELQPKDCIIVDESLTSGGSYWAASAARGEFTHLALTGGAIGQGMPCALGASIACPDKVVINIQADGSALYTVQSLISQKMKNCNVITIICANDTYQILRVEQRKQGLKNNDAEVPRALTSLDGPKINWCALSRGHGVPAESAETGEELRAELSKALALGGPRLIAAQLPSS